MHCTSVHFEDLVATCSWYCIFPFFSVWRHHTAPVLLRPLLTYQWPRHSAHWKNRALVIVSLVPVSSNLLWPPVLTRHLPGGFPPLRSLPCNPAEPWLPASSGTQLTVQSTRTFHLLSNVSSQPPPTFSHQNSQHSQSFPYQPLCPANPIHPAPHQKRVKTAATDPPVTRSLPNLFPVHQFPQPAHPLYARCFQWLNQDLFQQHLSRVQLQSLSCPSQFLLVHQSHKVLWCWWCLKHQWLRHRNAHNRQLWPWATLNCCLWHLHLFTYPQGRAVLRNQSSPAGETMSAASLAAGRPILRALTSRHTLELTQVRCSQICWIT